MKRWRERLRTFLEARNGIDQIAVFLMGLTVICLLTGALLRFPVLSLLGCLILLYLYFRILSGKKERRRLENMSFLGMREHLRFRRQVRRLEKSMKKTCRYIRCGACGRKYRISREKLAKIEDRAKGASSAPDAQSKETEGRIRCPWCGAVYKPIYFTKGRSGK